MLRKFLRYYIGSVCLLAVTACTQVELCDLTVHPHEYPVDLEYHWTEDQQQPDSMHIVANRVVNVCRYLFNYDVESETASESIYRPGVNEETQYLTGSEPTDTASLTGDINIRGGQYRFLTINNNEYLKVDSLTDFYEDLTRSMTKFHVIPVTTSKPILNDKEITNWPDMNQGYPYSVNIGPVYKAETSVVIGQGNTNKIDFYPEEISQNLTFIFHIQCEEDVEIENVTAELSGVVHSQDISSGRVNMDGSQTSRVLFTMKPDTSTGSITCTGNVDVIGLMNSYSPDLRSGPGMFTVGITAKAKNRNTGIELRKTLFAQLNLYSLIEENPLLQATEDKLHYLLATHKAVFEIQETLPVTYNELMGEYDANGRLDMWNKQPEYNGLDIEI